MNDAAIPLAVAIAYLSLISFSLYVFVRWLTFRGRVIALIAAQAFLAVHFLFLKLESLYWLTWPFVWPSWNLAMLFESLSPTDPRLSFEETLDRLARTVWTCVFVGYVCNSVVLGAATGFVSDVARRRRRRKVLRKEFMEPVGTA